MSGSDERGNPNTEVPPEVIDSIRRNRVRSSSGAAYAVPSAAAGVHDSIRTRANSYWLHLQYSWSCACRRASRNATYLHASNMRSVSRNERY